MPNHTTNCLQLNGTPKDVDAFIALVSNGEQKFDFNKIAPLPDELKETVAGWSKMTEEEEKQKEKRDAELTSKYGHSDWYGWQCDNWGTKWNAYDFSGDWDNNDGSAYLTFYTAWSPPTPLLIKASKKFPEIEFQNGYSDEGGGFVGRVTIKNGEIVDSFEPEWFSREGMSLREDLGSYYDDSEYEIEGRLEYLAENPKDGDEKEIKKLKKKLKELKSLDN